MQAESVCGEAQRGLKHPEMAKLGLMMNLKAPGARKIAARVEDCLNRGLNGESNPSQMRNHEVHVPEKQATVRAERVQQVASMWDPRELELRCLLCSVPFQGLHEHEHNVSVAIKYKYREIREPREERGIAKDNSLRYIR